MTHASRGPWRLVSASATTAVVGVLTLLTIGADPATADGPGQRLVVEIPPHTVPTAGAEASGLLPRTGGAVALWIVLLAVGLILVGAVLVARSRRAQSPASTAVAKASGASTIG